MHCMAATLHVLPTAFRECVNTCQSGCLLPLQDGEGSMGQPVPASSSQNLATAERRYKELFYVRVHQLISSMVAAVGVEETPR